jgi:2-polyprenyl-3-methyl-5-hydroxy-6-metoxy-1,4-benzoquinol methylase
MTMIFERKKHWDNVYQEKNIDEVSWYQPIPATSLDFVKQFNLAKNATIIDIGGGDSFLVDHLLDMGYQDITVLDISEQAIERAQKRLGTRANKVKWIIADAANFHATEKYDLWHDRAAFHFLTDQKEIESYLNTVNKGVKPEGILVIGTFSEQGPEICSGIKIKQYSEKTMTDQLNKFFNKIKCITVDHKTPSGSIQNFIFCSFRRLATA